MISVDPLFHYFFSKPAVTLFIASLISTVTTILSCGLIASETVCNSSYKYSLIFHFVDVQLGGVLLYHCSLLLVIVYEVLSLYMLLEFFAECVLLSRASHILPFSLFYFVG